MKDPRKALRTAYVTALASVTYDGSTVPVYDKVPKNATYPYIGIAEHTTLEGSDKTSYGQEVTILLDIVTGFSPNVGGKKPSDDIANEVMQVIHVRGTNLDLSADNFNIVTTFLDSDISQDEITENHAIFRRLLRFRHHIEQTDETKA